MKRYFIYNAERDQHNIEHAKCMLRNRMYLAREAGDKECEKRYIDRLERIDEADPGYSRYAQKVYGEAGELLESVINWAKMSRVVACGNNWYAQYAD